MSRNHKVIGYFAYSSPSEVVCTGGNFACVIAGSEKTMREYIENISPGGSAKTTIKKTRFGDILKGMQLGAAYAFDEESYARFYPLAILEGLPVEKADFSKQKEKLFTVKMVSS